jgi:hypothetical protein
MLIEHDIQAQLICVFILIQVPLVKLVPFSGIVVLVGEGHTHRPISILDILREERIRHLGKMISQHTVSLLS